MINECELSYPALSLRSLPLFLRRAPMNEHPDQRLDYRMSLSWCALSSGAPQIFLGSLRDTTGRPLEAHPHCRRYASMA
jgi:hypothetical protein